MPRFPPNPDSCKNHFALLLKSLNSSGAEPGPAQSLFRTGTMNASAVARRGCLACLLLLAPVAMPVRASKSALPPETPAILDKIYAFDLDGAVEAAKRMEQERPNHPLGYLLETEALWWRIWCTSADFKYGMSDARRRPKLEADRHYFELAAKVLSLAEAQIKQSESAEMQFYDGIGEASSVRSTKGKGAHRPRLGGGKVPGKLVISIGARRPVCKTRQKAASFGLLSHRKRPAGPERGVPDPCPGTGARLDRSAGHEERERGPLSDTRKKGVQCPGRGNTEIKNDPSSLLYSVKFLAASSSVPTLQKMAIFLSQTIDSIRNSLRYTVEIETG